MAKKKGSGLDQAFLDEIAERPGDDAPRLVYADWLDENGQPHRAEFIRLQCRLASMDEYDPERLALEQRQADLLSVYREAWEPPLPSWARLDYRPDYHRGFLKRISITATDFVKRPAALFAATPVSDLEIRNLRDKMPQVAASPLLGRVIALDFQENRLSPNDLRTLGASPHLGALEGLALPWTELTEPAGQALADWPTLPRLRRLELSHRGAPGLGALAATGRLTGLARLEVQGHVTSAGLRALAAAAPSLTHLSLISSSITPEGMAALARPGKLPALTSVKVEGQEHRADPLAGSALVGRLSSLELNFASLSKEGVAALTARSRLSRLRRLSLKNTCLGTNLPLLASALLDALVHLDLGGTYLDADEVGRLAASPRLAGLRWLGLSDNPFGDDGAAALAASPHLRGLTYLDLGDCEIGPAGVAALASSPNLAGLRYLSLWGNPLGAEGVQALAGSPHLGELRVLELFGVEAREEGMRALARSKGLGNLRHLHVYNNNLKSSNSKVFREFADPSRLPNLLVLAREPWSKDASELTKLRRPVVL